MLTYTDINTELKSRLPEIVTEAQHIHGCYGDPRVKTEVFYFSAFNKILMQLLEVSLPDEELLWRMFRFMEEMAQSKDADVRQLLQITILEKLWDDTATLRRAERRMFPYTRRVSDNILGYYASPAARRARQFD